MPASAKNGVPPETTSNSQKPDLYCSIFTTVHRCRTPLWGAIHYYCADIPGDYFHGNFDLGIGGRIGKCLSQESTDFSVYSEDKWRVDDHCRGRLSAGPQEQMSYRQGLSRAIISPIVTLGIPIMADLSIIFHNVSFTYAAAVEPLFTDVSLHLVRGWTGVVGANGVGKSTLLKLATGKLKPQNGHAVMPELTIYCPQRTDTVPEHLPALVQAMESDAFAIKGRLGIGDDWVDRWATLSHGERKRAQIAVALWRKPQVLAVDEPTNHLDMDAQHLLFNALATFNGIGILVSHNRRFLDELCHQCLFVEPPHALLRPGNYTQGLQLIEKEEMAAARQRQHAKQELSRIKRVASKRRDSASQADRKRSKRGISHKDHDAKGKIDQARVTGKDGSEQTITTVCRVDTPIEIDYYRNGGILQTVLRELIR